MRSSSRRLTALFLRRVAPITALIVFLPGVSRAQDTGSAGFELVDVTQDPPTPRFPGWTIDGKGGTASRESSDFKIVYSWLVPQRLRVGETVTLSGYAATKSPGLRVDIALSGSVSFDRKDSDVHLVADWDKPISDSKTIRITAVPNLREHTLTVSMDAVSLTYLYKPVSTDTVPNVVGMPWEEAIAELRRAGLEPLGVTNLGSAPSPDKANRIVAQVPLGRSKKDPNNKRVELTWYDKYYGGPGAPAAPPVAPPTPPARPARDCPTLIAEYQQLQKRDAELQRQIDRHRGDPILDYARDRVAAGVTELQRTASAAAWALRSTYVDPLKKAMTAQKKEEVKEELWKADSLQDLFKKGLKKGAEVVDAINIAAELEKQIKGWGDLFGKLAADIPTIPVPASSAALVKSLEQRRSALLGRIQTVRNEANAQGCTLPDASPTTGNAKGGAQFIGSNALYMALLDRQQTEAATDGEIETLHALAFWLLVISEDGSSYWNEGSATGMVMSALETTVARVSKGTIVVAPSGVGSTKTPLEFKTPEARINPRGTAFLLHRDAEASLTFVYVGEGAVEVTPASGGAPVTVNTGQIAIAIATDALVFAPDESAGVAGGGTRPPVPTTSGAPAVSRGFQSLPISYQECLSRAHRAFVAEGYTASPSKGESFVLGRKGNHGAYITCGVGPDNEAEVNVFVATAGSRDGGVPGRERERLQQQMASSR